MKTLSQVIIAVLLGFFLVSCTSHLLIEGTPQSSGTFIRSTNATGAKLYFCTDSQFRSRGRYWL